MSKKRKVRFVYLYTHANRYLLLLLLLIQYREEESRLDGIFNFFFYFKIIKFYYSLKKKKNPKFVIRESRVISCSLLKKFKMC